MEDEEGGKEGGKGGRKREKGEEERESDEENERGRKSIILTTKESTISIVTSHTFLVKVVSHRLQ